MVAQREDLAALISAGVLRSHAEAILDDPYEHAVRHVAEGMGGSIEAYPLRRPFSIDELPPRNRTDRVNSVFSHQFSTFRKKTCLSGVVLWSEARSRTISSEFRISREPSLPVAPPMGYTRPEFVFRDGDFFD
jgi:hypothetical protein